MKKEERITTTPGGQRPADAYPQNNGPTDNYPTDTYPTDDVKDSSRYSHPDKRPDKTGPGGDMKNRG